MIVYACHKNNCLKLSIISLECVNFRIFFYNFYNQHRWSGPKVTGWFLGTKVFSSCSKIDTLSCFYLTRHWRISFYGGKNTREKRGPVVINRCVIITFVGGMSSIILRSRLSLQEELSSKTIFEFGFEQIVV